LFNCFVAEINSNVEGMAIVYNRYSTWKGKTIHLEDLIVTKKMRNNGIGALLLDKVILFGKEMGVKRISWEVIDWNIKAIKFYERKGAKLIPDWNIIHLNEEAIKNYH
jgi:GNAT superfamily N-acetyltransferase